MKLITVLQRILILKDTAYISGLGTFIAKYKPAEFDKNTNSFSPPTKEIIFDTEYNSNDINVNEALLAEGLNPEQISNEIASFVESVKDLKDAEKFEIEGLGYFYKQNEKILFKNESNYSLDINNYGFEKIKVSANINSRNQKEPLKEIKKETVTKEKVQLKETNKEINKVAEKEKVSEKETKQKQEVPVKEEKVVEKAEIKKENNTLKAEIKPTADTNKKKFNIAYVLIPFVVVLIIALGFIYRKPIISLFSNKKNTKDTTQITKVDTIKHNTNDNNYNELLGNNEEYKKILNSKIKNTANVYLGTNYKFFYIIANSFSSKENADNFAQQLRQKGFNPEIIDGNKYFRVTLGGYDYADDLIKDYNHLKNNFGKDIWILINKQ